MRRYIAILLIVLAFVPLSGCKFFRWIAQHCRTVTVNVNNRGQVTAGVTCRFGAEPSHPIPDGVVKVVSQLDRAVSRGASLNLDECGDVCTRFGEDSDECDQCRSLAGSSVMNPSIPACQGTSYQPLPSTLRGPLLADTNQGMRTSPFSVTFTKDTTSIGFDGCGGERAEYTLQDPFHQQSVRSWSQDLINQGVRQVYSVSTIPSGGAEEAALFTLQDTSGTAECLNPGPDPLRCGVYVGGFIFGTTVGEDVHGFLSERMLPQRVAGIGGGYVFSGQGTLIRRP